MTVDILGICISTENASRMQGHWRASLSEVHMYAHAGHARSSCIHHDCHQNVTGQ